MATWSNLDESIKENFKEEANLCLMVNISKVIDYYSNSEYENVDVQALLEKLRATISIIKDLKKQVKNPEEFKGKLKKENTNL